MKLFTQQFNCHTLEPSTKQKTMTKRSKNNTRVWQNITYIYSRLVPPYHIQINKKFDEGATDPSLYQDLDKSIGLATQ